MGEESAAKQRRISYVLLLGAAIFLVNDLALPLGDYRWWLTVDYGTRLLVVACCITGAAGEAVDGYYRPPPPLAGLLWVVVLSASAELDFALRPDWGDAYRLFSYPAITDPYWRMFDTLAGLALVAFSEEILVRGVFLAWARGRGWHPAVVVATSSAFFAAMHWSLGLASITTAFVFGVLAMASVLATRSLWPAILGHWITDVILFTSP